MAVRQVRDRPFPPGYPGRPPAPLRTRNSRPASITAKNYLGYRTAARRPTRAAYQKVVELALAAQEHSAAIREESRARFWAFRRYMHPTMKLCWWQQEIANEFQLFHHSLINGERPKLVLMAQPDHGRTEQVTDFVAWLAGKEPDLNTIFASHSHKLGVGVNTELQRIMTSELYVSTFGHRLVDRSSWRGLRNRRILEYVNHRGSFYNTTVNGQINGMQLDIGILDNLNDRAETSSKAARDKIWNWFTDDFSTRFSNLAGVLFITTRWHRDDPIGRFISCFPETKILRYCAIAEEHAEHSKGHS